MELAYEKAKYLELSQCSLLASLFRQVPKLRTMNRITVKETRGLSFAVPKAKLPSKGKPLLAIRQPDHDPAYTFFEGSIPEGEYGAGKVLIVSQGKAWIWSSSPDNLHVTLVQHGGYDKSHQFVLMRDTRKTNQGDSWLWVRKSLNLPARVGKHRFKSLDELPQDASNFVVEEKIDGAWTVIRVSDGHVRAFSHRISKRDGDLIEYTSKVPKLHDGRLGSLPDCILAAELFHPRGAAYLGGLLNRTDFCDGLKDEAAHEGIGFKLLDVLSYNGTALEERPYIYRRDLMEDLSRCHKVPVVSCCKGQRTERFYANTVTYRKPEQVVNDGIVLKPKTGTDTDVWYRFKPVDTYDCTIEQFNEGNGRHRGSLGSMLCRMPSGKRVNVGTGFNDAERQHIWQNKDIYRGEVVEVAFHERKCQVGTGPRVEPGAFVPMYVRNHPTKSEIPLRQVAEGLNVTKYKLINRKR